MRWSSSSWTREARSAVRTFNQRAADSVVLMGGWKFFALSLDGHGDEEP